MGGIVVKKVKGNEYIYYSYYDNGKKLSLYCGLKSDPNSKRRAKEFRIEELEKQQEKIALKIRRLNGN